MKTILIGGAILAVLMGVSACGQRGPLVLPTGAPAQAQPTQAQQPAPR